MATDEAEKRRLALIEAQEKRSVVSDELQARHQARLAEQEAMQDRYRQRAAEQEVLHEQYKQRALEQERMQKEASRLQALAAQNMQRGAALLDRWDEITRRFEAALTELESKL